MSWSKSASGFTAEEIRLATQPWASQVAQSDTDSKQNDATKALHQDQVKRATTALESFAAANERPGYLLTVGGGGHAYVDESGSVKSDSVWANCSTSVSVQTEQAAPTTEAASGTGA